MRKRIVFIISFLPFWVMAAPVQPLDKVVAVVNDGVITASELDAQVEMLRQQIVAKKMQLPSGQVLRKQVLQHLIDVDLELQLAKRNDVEVDDSDLNAAIERVAETNKLSLSQMREAIAKQGIDWEEYRKNIRKEIAISRVQQKAIGANITVTPKQVDDYLKTADHQAQQAYHIQNIVIPLPETPTTEQINRAKAKARVLLGKIKTGEDFSRLAIAESSGEFALEGGDLGPRHLAELPEVFAKQVVTMKPGETVGPIRTGNGFQLIKLVGVDGSSGRHEVTKMHVRHILLKPDSSMTSEETNKQISNIYQQIKSGKDFAVMAKQYSLDAGSAIKGGDLGWVTGDELVPQFAQAIKELPLHTVSKPVKSPFGWHLIEVLERKTEDDSGAFQRQQVAQFLQQRKFAEAVQNWQQHMRTEAYIKILEKDLA